MGGPVQAEEGILGGIVGSSEKNLDEAKLYLESFCKNIFHFGPVGVAAKAKLISNFLSLGTTTFVIETVKAAKHFNIDLQKLYDVAKLGSGNSGALNRIAENQEEMNATLTRIANHYDGVVPVMTRNAKRAEAMADEQEKGFAQSVKNIFAPQEH